LWDRKSVRAFEDKAISNEDKETILTSALQAPSAGNQILYTILDIDDKKTKHELSIICDNQPFIEKAQMVLIFLADCQKWLSAYEYAGIDARKPGIGDILLACEDAAIAAQNTVTAAQSLGIGSCYIGDILENKEKTVELLNLGQYVVPITMVVFGYPTEQQKTRTKPKRFDLKYVVQKNTYSKMDEKRTREMFNELHKNEQGYNYDEYIKAFCTRKYMSDFSLEMSRSVYEYLKVFISPGGNEQK
jgi:nitroreductase